MSFPIQPLPGLTWQRPFVLFWLARLASTIGYLLVAAVWMMQFPDLRRLDRFEPADKASA